MWKFETRGLRAERGHSEKLDQEWSCAISLVPVRHTSIDRMKPTRIPEGDSKEETYSEEVRDQSNVSSMLANPVVALQLSTNLCSNSYCHRELHIN